MRKTMITTHHACALGEMPTWTMRIFVTGKPVDDTMALVQDCAALLRLSNRHGFGYTDSECKVPSEIILIPIANYNTIRIIRAVRTEMFSSVLHRSSSRGLNKNVSRVLPTTGADGFYFVALAVGHDQIPHTSIILCLALPIE